MEGVPHHISQRGNGRQIIFDTIEGRLVYLDLLRKYAERFGLSIWAYCLMGNHVHLLAVPPKADSLARALGRAHADYARYLNICRRSCGHVWEARYFSCPLDEQHLWRAMAYIERNPVRAGLCARAEDYQWSSAQAHIHGSSGGGMLDLRAWRERYDGRAWGSILAVVSEDDAFQRRLQEATLRGRPCCEPEMLEVFEQRLGRGLRARPPGRPQKRYGQEESQIGLGLAAGE